MSASIFIIQTGMNYEGANSLTVATTTREAAEAIAAEVQALIDANDEYHRKDIAGEEMDGEKWYSHWEGSDGSTLIVDQWVSITEVPVIG